MTCFLPFILSDGVSHRLLSADTVQAETLLSVFALIKTSEHESNKKWKSSRQLASLLGPDLILRRTPFRWTEIPLFCHAPTPCLLNIFTHPPSPFALHFYSLVSLLSLLSVSVKRDKSCRVAPDRIFKVKSLVITTFCDCPKNNQWNNVCLWSKITIQLIL